MITPTPAGEMRDVVTLLKRNTRATNELNEQVAYGPNDYDELAEVWAKVSPKSATEAVQNAAQEMNVTHEVRLRYTNQIGHQDAIMLGSSRLDIVELLDIENQHIELLLRCNMVES